MIPANNRVVIVTGASRGLGREIAIRFGLAGNKVIVNYLRHADEADLVVRSLEGRGGTAAAICADVSRAVDADAMIAKVQAMWGRIDVLVNNAGIVRDALLVRMQEQDWDDVLRTNLYGPFHCMRAVSDIMIRQQEGHIISIGSLVGVRGREGQANYASSKAGLIGLTRAAARELGASNIKVNAVLPGYLQTDMGTAADHVHERVVGENVLGRISEPAEIADFVHYLSTMKNISGQVFNLDSRIA